MAGLARKILTISEVYNRLFKQSLNKLDALVNAVMANKLRMSDDERLSSIDNIFSDMQEKIVFLTYFNCSTALLGMQRSREQNEVDRQAGRSYAPAGKTPIIKKAV